MGRNPSKQRCGRLGCRAWAQRGSLFCASHQALTPTSTPIRKEQAEPPVLETPPSAAVSDEKLAAAAEAVQAAQSQRASGVQPENGEPLPTLDALILALYALGELAAEAAASSEWRQEIASIKATADVLVRTANLLRLRQRWQSHADAEAADAVARAAESVVEVKIQHKGRMKDEG